VNVDVVRVFVVVDDDVNPLGSRRRRDGRRSRFFARFDSTRRV